MILALLQIERAVNFQLYKPVARARFSTLEKKMKSTVWIVIHTTSSPNTVAWTFAKYLRRGANFG